MYSEFMKNSITTTQQFQFAWQSINSFNLLFICVLRANQLFQSYKWLIDCRSGFSKLLLHCKYVHGKYHVVRIFEIPGKVVYFEIFLHWFKCTNYSLYDIKNISRHTTEIPFICCTWDSK